MRPLALTGRATPLVSVIMPVYDKEDVVREACLSVLAQIRSDLELIVVDDASTDGTADVVADLCASDPRVRLVRNQANSRRGPIEWEPRNDGLQVARGELIAYLDADNTWEPSFLETLVGALQDDPGLQLVYCRSRNFHPCADIAPVIAADRRHAVDRGDDWVVFAHDELVLSQLGHTQYVDTNEIVHRSSVFRRLGSLWHTVHPRRDWVSSHQGKVRPHRRHNDLDLVERIAAAFGAEALAQVPQVLVNFHYPGARRGRHGLRSPSAARR